MFVTLALWPGVASQRAQAQTNFKLLHTFGVVPGDGIAPGGGLIRAGGSLYGTTYGGGSYGGTVFKVDSKGKETILYNFRSGSDGIGPFAGVVRDTAGNLYGTTSEGGANGFGSVFEVSATGEETVLYSFQGGSDGANPYAPLVRDSYGNLYGTTSISPPNPSGTVFKVDSSGQETVLYRFLGPPDGFDPSAGLLRDSLGNFYSTTPLGGAASFGIVYKVSAAGKETVLHNFTGGLADGAYSYSSLLRVAGNLYGTAEFGGTYGVGVVFKLDPHGNETLLYSFLGGPVDGAYPNSGLLRDAAGNFYGTTEIGGLYGWGTVFKLDPTGKETVLHNFTGGADGSIPIGGVVRDSLGNLYGVTQEGGYGSPIGAGTVYELTN